MRLESKGYDLVDATGTVAVACSQKWLRDLQRCYNAFADLNCEDPEGAVRDAIKQLEQAHKYLELDAKDNFLAEGGRNAIEHTLGLFGLERVNGGWRTRE